MAWTQQTPDEVDALFQRLRARDPFGHRLHLAFALAVCVLAAFPTTWLEWAWWPCLAVCSVRMFSHHRILGPLVWEWPVRLTIAWVAWGAASLLWTAGTREAWLAEWGVARYALLIPALWPVMNERRWLIAAIAAGVLVGNLTQAGHAIGRAADIPWLTWPRFEDRNSGWWDPVVGGSILCAALGLHLPGCILGRSLRERATGAAFCAVTVAAIAATGTRGAWIGAAAVITISLLIAGLRLLRGGDEQRVDANPARAARSVLIVAVLAVVCGAAAWLAAGDTISRRVREAREEVSRAMEGDYSTFTGARLAMWGWAGRAFAAHPVLGVGEGGYKAWVQREAHRAAGGSPGRSPRPEVHAHAHSMPLHAAATTGAVGAALLGGLVLACARNGLRTHRAGLAWGYDAAPALAMIGLLCAGFFDSIQVNQQTAYWMWLLVALCMLRRPTSEVRTAGGDER